MEISMLIIWIVAAVVVLFLIASYNKLVVLRNRARNGFSQIDVQLKRRADLIPNLVKTVKGYAKHEKTVLENITKARSALLKADKTADKAKADNMLSGALKSLFAVAENYPQLKANENFLKLQEELSGTEDKVAYSRQFYNDTVMSLNNSIETFPTNMIANLFRFKKMEFFRAPEGERKAVKVEF
jgi:LemA protein